MDQLRHFPDRDRLNVLAAVIMLAFALSRFVQLPVQDWSVQLPCLYLTIQINVYTIVALLVAGLTASGADWLLRDHPALKERNTFQHWLLPALTAWVVGIPLFQLPLGFIWWIVFVIGGALLMAVLVAEYIVVDPHDLRQPPAMAGLTAVSYALYLVLAIVLRASGVRLFLILPALVFAAWLVSLRTLNLRLRGVWRISECGVIALIAGQLIAAFHYWSLSPVSYGLVILGPTYALTSLIGSLVEGESARPALLPSLLTILVTWGIAFWLQ